jgi:hypothetical protein
MEEQKNPLTADSTAFDAASMDITFVWHNFLIACLEAMLYWQRPRAIPTHVQIRLNGAYDISAEMQGIKKVRHDGTINNCRRLESYRYPGKSPEIIEKFKGVIAEIFAKKIKYDFFFYIRWFLNVMIIPALIWLGYSILKKQWWVAIFLFILYFPLNKWLKKMSRKTWACSEISSKIYREFGSHFVIGRRFDRSSPYIMWLMVNFAGWQRTEAYQKGSEETAASSSVFRY